MPRLVVIHWGAPPAWANSLGGEVTAVCPRGPADLKPLLDAPPDAFLIDFSRAPSQGRDIAIAFRNRKATRRVPIVFVGGDAEKVARTRTVLPDAAYAEPARAREAVLHAIANPPADPVRPNALAGYSGTPLPKKLGIKPNSTVALLHAPDGFEHVLGTLPVGAQLRRDARTPAPLVLLFATTQAALEKRFAAARRALAEGGRLWIVWPKKTSALAGDISEKSVRAFGLASGFVDYKVSAIDATWSGLAFARRG